MYIVRIIGGLGNQMFQYAFYEAIKEQYGDAAVDVNSFDNYNLHNGYELERIFGVKCKYSDKLTVEKLKDNKSDFFSKLRRKIIGTKKSYYIEKDYSYDSDVFNLKLKKDLYFDGFWQTEKYFKHISNSIRNKLSFKEIDSGENMKILNRINNTESVSIHVRRGDYYSNPNAFKKHGGICEIEYYNMAINIIKNKIKNPMFFIFSDDIEWVKKYININNKVMVDLNTASESYRDMQLMSNCKYNIIANSTFSWWGAWLNDHKNKIVIAPKKWFNYDINTKDVIPDEWIKI